MTKPVTIRLQCECGRGLKLTYDASVPTKLLSFDCVCGRSAPIGRLPDEPTGQRHMDEVVPIALSPELKEAAAMFRQQCAPGAPLERVERGPPELAFREPTREHPTTDPAAAYRTTCNHPADARGLTGCLLCGAPF